MNTLTEVVARVAQKAWVNKLCVNERRKEMKRWMESSKSTDSQ